MIRNLTIGTAGGLGVAGAIYYAQKQQQQQHRVNELAAATAKNIAAKRPPKPRWELPPHVQYLLIGGGAPTYGAYRAIKAADPKAKVLIVGEEDHLPYMRSALNKELWQGNTLNEKLTFKQWNGRERSIMFEHPEYYTTLDELKKPEGRGVAYCGGLKAEQVDPKNSVVRFADGSEVKYDRCMLSLESVVKRHPVLSKVPGIERFVVEFNTIEDFKSLQESALRSGSIAVIGGDTLASELAINILDFAYRANPKLKVIQIFPELGNMSSLLPEYLAKWLSRQLSAAGVTVISGQDIVSAEVVDNKQVRLKLTSGQEHLVDRIAVASGPVPNIEIARKSGLEVDDKSGGVVANAELETRRNLFVAGDGCSFFDQRLGRRRFEGHEHGVLTGRIAGKNMTGAQKPYGLQSLMWSDVGSIVSFEGVGLLNPKLETFSVFFPESPEEQPDFNGRITKGVVFYKNDKGIVVGVLLCNIFGRINDARKLISEEKPLDLKEVAKVFYERGPTQEELESILADEDK